ncbi:MAG TPA: hypothetical protein VGG24_07715, partial [Paraburkholderia sp.]
MKSVPEFGRRRAVAALGASLCAPLLSLVDVSRALADEAAPASAAAAAAPAVVPAAGRAPALETVATFGDDFRLVGIGVSSTGRVFATAPSSIKRSRYSVVEVDTVSGELHPFPDTRWNHYDPHGA